MSNPFFRSALVCLAVISASSSALADTPWKGFALNIRPSCQGERPARVQPVDQQILLMFEKNFPRQGQTEIEYLPLGGRRLAVVEGNVMLSDVPAAGASLSWKTIGRADLSTLNCNWPASQVKVQLLSGESATLHEIRSGECREQNEDDSLIPLLDSDYTKPTEFRLELSLANGSDNVALSGSGSTWYESQWQCIRAHGDRVTTLR